MHFRESLKLGGVLLGALTALTFAGARPAEACGGLFCSSANPVNQAAERIIFSDNPDGTVTAVVEILYEGPADSFSWLLPVPGVPDIALSSTDALDLLQAATNPVYRLTTTMGDDCDVPDFAGDGDSGDGDGDGDGDVTVLASGQAGPYDYEVIEVDDQLPDAAEVVLDWLGTNGYDVDDIGADLVRPYLDDGMNFLAFRLTKNAEAGEIRPVMLTYESDIPMIPIRPTAVAATADMGILVWTLGESRAVPVNFRSLVLNEALIDWFAPNRNYNDVVIAAANEAGGQGFVTEEAGATDVLNSILFTGNMETQWQQLSTSDWTGDEGGLLGLAISRYSGWDGFDAVLNDQLNFPDGVTADTATYCPSGCDFPTTGAYPELNAAAFIAALDELVVRPVSETQDLLNARPYFTRLYTTLSADEMTEDPLFDFNPTLGDVDRTHTRERIVDCSGDVATWAVDFDELGSVRGEGQFANTWPVDASMMPANSQVLQDDTAGEPSVVTDNRDEIRTALDAAFSGPGGGPEPDGMEPDVTNPPNEMMACACVSSSPTRGAGGAFALFGLLFVLRRRRSEAAA